MITEGIKAELEKVRAGNGGLIRPVDLVQAAGNAEAFPEIYSYFNAQGGFDPAIALEQFQLQLARELIVRVRVEVPDSSGKMFTVRAYTSLASDRTQGGGYRALEEVMRDDGLRAVLLETALQELTALRDRYGHLKELAVVFQATDTLVGPDGSGDDATT